MYSQLLLLFILLPVLVYPFHNYYYYRDISGPEMIISYLRVIHTKSLIIINCWKNSDAIRFVKYLESDNNFKISLVGHQKYLQNLKSGQKYNASFLLDFSCDMSYEVLSESGKFAQFTNWQKWLILTDFTNTDENILINSFKDIKFRTDSNVRAVTYDEINEFFMIYDLYNPGFKNGGKTIIKKIGHYSESTKELSIDSFSLYEERKNLTSLYLRLATVTQYKRPNESLEDYMDDLKRKDLISHTKFFYTVCIYLRQTHGFRNNFTLSDKWFGEYPNGTDSGVSKLAFEDQIDLSCSGMFIRERRLDAIGMLCPLYPFRTIFFFRNLGHHALLKNEFLTPFTDSVWYCCLLYIVLITLLFKIINWTEKTYMKSSINYAWFTALLVTTAAFLQKEVPLYPTKVAGRLVYFFLMVLVFILYNYYTSSIVASLINAKPDPIKNLGELKETKITCSIENTPYVITYVNQINDPQVVSFFKSKIMLDSPNPHFDTAVSGVSKVKKGGFAYHNEDSGVYPLIEKTYEPEEICQLEEIVLIGTEHIPMMTQKNSEFNNMFRVSIRKMESAGIIKKEIAFWRARRPECLSGTKFEPVGIEPLFMAFFIYFICIGIAGALLVVEMTWYRCEKSKSSSS